MNPNTKEIAKLLAGALIERRDVRAVQRPNGSYNPERSPWQLQDVIDHIEGKATYGHYVVSAENTCRIFAFDIDLMKSGHYIDIEAEAWRECEPREVWAGEESAAKADLRAQLFCMAAGLASRVRTVLDIQCLVTYSGSKGLHVYGLLDRGTPAHEAREAAILVLDSFGCFVPSRGKNFYRHEDDYRALEVEVYPKQDAVRDGDGLGNLLRLPLGRNLKTGDEGFFVTLHHAGPLNGPFIPDDPLLALTEGSHRAGFTA